MNKKLHELSLQAGGSHYPSINSDLQEKFAKLIINECIAAVLQTQVRAATTYDRDVGLATVEQCADSIRKLFADQ